MTDIPPAALEAAAKALTEADCICPTGRNQYGGWYSPQPTCPRCGDSAAKALVALAAALPHLLCSCPHISEVDDHCPQHGAGAQ